MSFDVDEKTGEMIPDITPEPKLWQKILLVPVSIMLHVVDRIKYGKTNVTDLDELPRFEDELGFPKKSHTSSNKLNVDDNVLEEILKDCENFVYPDDEEYEEDFFPLSKRDLMIIKFKCKLSKIKDLIFGIDEDYKIPSLDELPNFIDEYGPKER